MAKQSLPYWLTVPAEGANRSLTWVTGVVYTYTVSSANAAQQLFRVKL
jgi:hypothetical protein